VLGQMCQGWGAGAVPPPQAGRGCAGEGNAATGMAGMMGVTQFIPPSPELEFWGFSPLQDWAEGQTHLMGWRGPSW